MKFLEKLSAKAADKTGKAPVTIAFLGDSVTQGCFELYKKNDGSIETILRHHTTIFKKLYSLIIGFSLVDSYEMTNEEEAALIADPTKFVAKITLLDEEGGLQTLELYKLTERKTYVVVNGSGGFYVSSSYVDKVVEGIELFTAGKDINIK